MADGGILVDDGLCFLGGKLLEVLVADVGEFLRLLLGRHGFDENFGGFLDDVGDELGVHVHVLVGLVFFGGFPERVANGFAVLVAALLLAFLSFFFVAIVVAFSVIVSVSFFGYHFESP